ncbi:MAG TPA: NADH:flavin oxidoreductase [Deltaproteobacteria bacterium]|nr:NADH:flavin oxidoreductase [Deltaproteobacteria bacterium]
MRASQAPVNQPGPLFTAIAINHLELKNRIFKAPTMEAMADEDGAPTDRMTRFFQRTAAGGSGLMITGLTYVNNAGKGYMAENGMHADRLIPRWKALTDEVHAAGGRIVMQISHAGRLADPRVLNGAKARAASAMPNLMYLHWAKRLTVREIREIIRDFGEAAGRVKSAGFDGVEIHSSGGYLLASFLSPLTNRRTDDWGGDQVRRFRLFEEVYHAVRRACGRDYPVFAKLHLGDFLLLGRPWPGNYDAGVRMQALGVDAIEFAIGVQENITITFAKGGMPIEVVGDSLSPLHRLYWKTIAVCYTPFTKFKGPYFTHAARELKRRGLTVPLLLSGGFRRFAEAEHAIASGTADLVGMSRPLLREPDLPRRWMSGHREDSTCVSCNRCTLGLVNATPIHCSYREEARPKRHP